MIGNDDSSIINNWSFKLIDNARVIIYDHNSFIIQATEKLGRDKHSSLLRDIVSDEEKQ
jgi:hypothetical protein